MVIVAVERKQCNIDIASPSSRFFSFFISRRVLLFGKKPIFILYIQKEKRKKRNSRICSNYIKIRIKIFFDNLFHPLYPSKGSEVRVQIVFHLPLAQVEHFIERSRSKYEKETRIRCNFWEKGNERRRGRRRKRRRRSRREPIRHRLRRSRLLFYSRVIPFPSPSPLPPAYP